MTRVATTGPGLPAPPAKGGTGADRDASGSDLAFADEFAALRTNGGTGVLRGQAGPLGNGSDATAGTPADVPDDDLDDPAVAEAMIEDASGAGDALVGAAGADGAGPDRGAVDVTDSEKARAEAREDHAEDAALASFAAGRVADDGPPLADASIQASAGAVAAPGARGRPDAAAAGSMADAEARAPLDALNAAKAAALRAPMPRPALGAAAAVIDRVHRADTDLQSDGERRQHAPDAPSPRPEGGADWQAAARAAPRAGMAAGGPDATAAPAPRPETVPSTGAVSGPAPGHQGVPYVAAAAILSGAQPAAGLRRQRLDDALGPASRADVIARVEPGTPGAPAGQTAPASLVVPFTSPGAGDPATVPLFVAPTARWAQGGVDFPFGVGELALLEAGRSAAGQPGAPAGAGGAASEPRNVARQIAEALIAARDDGVDLQLSPEELGRVKLSMTQGEGGLLVTISAERPETLDLLRRNIGLLGADLAASGFGDAAFSFADPHGERAHGNERATRAEPAIAERDDMPDAQVATAMDRGPRAGPGSLDIRV